MIKGWWPEEDSSSYIAKCAGPPVLTGRFAFGPAGAEHLPVQMSGRKNTQFLSTVEKIPQ
jgi:hypothetical protein